MTGPEYKTARAALGFTGRGFARLLGLSESPEQRWTRAGPPNPIPAVLRLMHAAGLDARRVAALLGRPPARAGRVRAAPRSPARITKT